MLLTSFRTWFVAMWLIVLAAVVGALWGAISTVALIATILMALIPLTVVWVLARRPRETLSESIRDVTAGGRN